jgi:hypothetical protein
MKKIYDNFVAVGFLVMSFGVSIFTGFTTSWQYHDLDTFMAFKTFGLIMVITLICDIPNLISNFKNRSKK